MQRFQRFAGRGLRSASLGGCLALAVVGVAGCSGVTIAPSEGAWTVTGEGSASQAVWRVGDVEVAVPLHYAADATSIAADVRNSGPDVARVTFSLPSGSGSTVPVGSVSAGAPTLDSPWSEPVLPGRPVDVPPATRDGPGTRRFALRPDTRWNEDAPPVVGSSVTLGITLTTQAGAIACPLSFRVTESSAAGWSGMTGTAQIVVSVLLLFVILAAAAWA